MNTKQLLFLLCMIGMSWGCSNSGKSPNIIIVLADDLGNGSVSYLSNYAGTITPNLDEMSKSSWRLDAHYATSPVCSPSRASLLTGLWPRAHKIQSVLRPGDIDTENGLDTSLITLPEMLVDAGYQTSLIGKWHLGYADHEHPLENGFQKFSGFINGHIDYISHRDPADRYGLERNGEPWSDTEGTFLTELLTTEAIEQIEASSRQPYFMMLSYANPHGPVLLPGEEAVFPVKPNSPEFRGKWERYRQLVAVLDTEIGRLVQAVERSGDNTLIIFLSDQGAPIEVRGNRPFFGGKGMMTEGGLKVPALFYWPAELEPKMVKAVTTHLDIMPTILAVTGIELDQGQKMHGRSLINDNRKVSAFTKVAKWEHGEAIGVRQGDWKAIFIPESKIGNKLLNKYERALGENSAYSWNPGSGESYLVWLFDMVWDPNEQNNLAQDKPDIVQELWDLQQPRRQKSK